MASVPAAWIRVKETRNWKWGNGHPGEPLLPIGHPNMYRRSTPNTRDEKCKRKKAVAKKKLHKLKAQAKSVVVDDVIQSGRNEADTNVLESGSQLANPVEDGLVSQEQKKVKLLNNHWHEWNESKRKWEISSTDNAKGLDEDLLRECGNAVSDHIIYQESLDNATEWIESTREKLTPLRSLEGDRHTTQANLLKVNELMSIKSTGDHKVTTLIEKAEVVYPSTSPKGVKEIRTAVQTVRSNMENLFQEMHDLNISLESLAEKWHQYEVKYDTLSSWVKDTENSLKADGDLKGSLEEKETILEKHMARHETIIAHQTELDALSEQGQSLLEMCDSVVSSQLTQLSSRYVSLLTLSKDMLKRYEQNVQDHQQYTDYYNKFTSWYQDIEGHLDICMDTSGDESTMQGQLERLKDISVQKEDGQNLLHTMQTWGEKTLTNSSLSGRDTIRQNLQKTHQDYETLTKRLEDNKVTLESCLLEWSDYGDRTDQVEKWLKETETKFKDSELKSELAEKKAQLQRLKKLNQDIVSYSHIIDTLTDSAHGLAVRSPHSNVTTESREISNKYQLLVKMAAVEVDKNEGIVKDHQGFNQAVSGFNTWIRVSRERLQASIDTYGDRDTIKANFEHLKELKAEVSKGRHKLDHASEQADATLPNTADSGLARINTDIKDITSDFGIYIEEIRQGKLVLEVCLGRWEDFDSLKEDFSSWMKATQQFLKGKISVETSLQEKRDQILRYQTKHEEILKKQGDLDNISGKAQGLLQTSHTITQLTTNYQALISMSKEILRKLESYYGDHYKYDMHQKEFITWSETTRLDLLTLQQTLDDLMKSIEDGINNLQTCLGQWGAYSDVLNKTGSRLSYIENKVALETGSHMTLVEKQDQLERIKTLKLTLMGDKSFVDRRREKFSELQTQSGDPQLTREKNLVVERYHMLLDKVEGLLSECDNVVSNHIIYQEAQDHATELVNSTREKSRNNLEGDRRTTQAKLLKDIPVQKEDGQNLLHTTQTLGEKYLTNSSVLGRDTIRQNLQKIQQDYETLTKGLTVTKVTLESCLLELSQYGDCTDQDLQPESEYEQDLHFMITEEEQLDAGSIISKLYDRNEFEDLCLEMKKLSSCLLCITKRPPTQNHLNVHWDNGLIVDRKTLLSCYFGCSSSGTNSKHRCHFHCPFCSHTRSKLAYMKTHVEKIHFKCVEKQLQPARQSTNLKIPNQHCNQQIIKSPNVNENDGQGAKRDFKSSNPNQDSNQQITKSPNVCESATIGFKGPNKDCNKQIPKSPDVIENLPTRKTTRNVHHESTECNECGKSMNISSLKRHIQTVHSSEGIFLVSRKKCGRQDPVHVIKKNLGKYS